MGAGLGVEMFSADGGSRMRKVVPFPGSLSTVIEPLRDLMIPWQIERPRPVPTPSGLVVKNGSKMRSRESCGIPRPVSEISITISPVGAVRVATRMEFF